MACIIPSKGSLSVGIRASIYLGSTTYTLLIVLMLRVDILLFILALVVEIILSNIMRPTETPTSESCSYARKTLHARRTSEQ